MILVLDLDLGLSLYASATEAEKNLEAIDVENGEYEFCDEHGQKFVGQVITPITRFRSGAFRLMSTKEFDSALPLLFVSRARRLDRSLEKIKSLAALKARLGENP